MTEKSRPTEDLVETSVESDDFIDAVLDLAENKVAVTRRRRELKQASVARDRQEAVDMIDGEVLSATATIADDAVVLDLTDGADGADGHGDRTTTGPVAKAQSRSAATARAAALADAKPKSARTDDVEELKQPKAEGEAKPAKKKQPKAKGEAKPAKKKQPKAKGEAKPAKKKQPKAVVQATEGQAAAAASAVASAKPAHDEPASAESVVVAPAAVDAALVEPDFDNAPAALIQDADEPIVEEELVVVETALDDRIAAVPVVDYRRTAAPVPVKRRRRPLRQLRRAWREFLIRRGSGGPKVPLTTRWRKARLRRMRAQRRAATQAALLGQDPSEVSVDEPNVVGYAAAVLVVAAIVVIALLVLT